MMPMICFIQMVQCIGFRENALRIQIPMGQAVRFLL